MPWIFLLLPTLLYCNTAYSQQAPAVDGVLIQEWVAGGADLGSAPIAVQLINQQQLTFEKSSITTNELAPGSNLTDIGLWQVQSNGAFSIKIESGTATDANSYTPPTYPAFTKADMNAAGRTVAGAYDELPAEFSLLIENIDSVCIGNNCDGLPIEHSAAERNASWGPKSGADFEKDLNANADSLLKVQVIDENLNAETAKVNIRLQATIPDLSREASIQPGTYTANLKVTVAATQTAP